MYMFWTRSLPLTCVLLLGVACTDDGGEDEGNDDDATESEESTGDSETGTGEASTDTSTEGETTEGETTEGETTEGETTESETTESEETSGGDCVDLDEQACDDSPDCQRVVGSPLQTEGPDAPCLEPLTFIGCIPAQPCGDAITWFCNGEESYEVIDTCGPEGFEMCEPPPVRIGACP